MPHRLLFHRFPVLPVLLAQLGVGSLAAAVSGWSWGYVAGYSTLLGVMIAWLPNLYFALRAFRFSGARAAQAIVRSFYAGEAGKLILTAVLFALVFAGIQPLAPLALFGGFLVVQMAHWFAPLLLKKRISRP